MPGDIIRLEEGDAIPADARLIEASALRTTEAALTGESVPVPKDTAPLAGGTDAAAGLAGRRNMVFSGTSATTVTYPSAVEVSCTMPRRWFTWPTTGPWNSVGARISTLSSKGAGSRLGMKRASRRRVWLVSTAPPISAIAWRTRTSRNAGFAVLRR